MTDCDITLGELKCHNPATHLNVLDGDVYTNFCETHYQQFLTWKKEHDALMEKINNGII
jgi:hypothetical protein